MKILKLLVCWGLLCSIVIASSSQAIAEDSRSPWSGLAEDARDELLDGLDGQWIVLKHVDDSSVGCLDVRWANRVNGQPVQTWECNGTPAQDWQLMRRSSGDLVGSFKLVSGLGGDYCLDNRGDFQDDGRMGIWRCVADSHSAAVNQTVDLEVVGDDFMFVFSRQGVDVALWASRSAGTPSGDASQKLDDGSAPSRARWQMFDGNGNSITIAIPESQTDSTPINPSSDSDDSSDGEDNDADSGDEPEEQPVQQSDANAPSNPKLDSYLNGLVLNSGTGTGSQGNSALPGFLAVLNSAILVSPQPESSDIGEMVAVTVNTNGSPSAVITFLEANGAQVSYSGTGWVEASVPVSLLTGLAGRDDVIGVDTILGPVATQSEVTSEGVASHLADGWHEKGYDGTGVKIGIIDVGFGGWSSLASAGEVPGVAGYLCWDSSTDNKPTSSNSSLDTDTEDDGQDDCGTDKHGSAVAEIIHDVAPAASIYIANPQSYAQLNLARRFFMAAYGRHYVDIIIMALAWQWDGPGNGTGVTYNSPYKSVKNAIDYGDVLWVNAAGNTQDKTYTGAYTETKGQVKNETNSTVTNDLVIWSGTDQANCFNLPAGETVISQMRWNDTWGGATIDLKLRLMEKLDNNSEKIKVWSDDDQTGGSNHNPYEMVKYTNTTTDTQEICLRAAAEEDETNPTWIQIQNFQGPDLEYTGSGGYAMAAPADYSNSSFLSVGSASLPSLTKLDAASAQGPTRASNVIKPDLVAAGGAQTVSYKTGNNASGPFGGTSAAAAHVAGMAALVMDRFGSYTNSQVATYLKDQADPRPVNNADPNNLWGHGLAQLEPLKTAVFISGPYTVHNSLGETGQQSVIPRNLYGTTTTWKYKLLERKRYLQCSQYVNRNLQRPRQNGADIRSHGPRKSRVFQGQLQAGHRRPRRISRYKLPGRATSSQHFWSTFGRAHGCQQDDQHGS